MCVDTYSLNCIQFPLWTLIDSFVWNEIVHGISLLANGTIKRCILYTNKVTKGNANLFNRISWCCLFSYFISELWGDGLWACTQLRSYSWWGCEYYMYHCRQKYTSNFMGKVDVCELYYWSASVLVGHPAGALAIICLWALLTWLTYAYGMLCQDGIAPGEFLLYQYAFQLFWTGHISWRVFTLPMCMLLFWTGHINSCMFMINYWSLYHQAAC